MDYLRQVENKKDAVDLASCKLQLQLQQKNDLQMSELRTTSHCTTNTAAVTGPHLCCWI